MELIECKRCGEVYPEEWPECPFCAAEAKPVDKFIEDEWN